MYLLFSYLKSNSTLESSKDYSMCWLLILNKLEMLVVMLILLLALMILTLKNKNYFNVLGMGALI